MSSSSSVSGKEDEPAEDEVKKEQPEGSDNEEEDYGKEEDDSDHDDPKPEDEENEDQPENSSSRELFADVLNRPNYWGLTFVYLCSALTDDRKPEMEAEPNTGQDIERPEESTSVEEAATATMETTAMSNTVVTSTAPRRDLHKTLSIFFRCLPPTITRGELDELCRSQPGFIRLAIYDPMPERRFTRHAWATYAPSVNIKKICWALNTSPLLREKWQQQSSSSGATVNRDLAQRLRPVTSAAALTRHRPVMRNDLRVASRLIAQLDTKHNLWPLPGQTGCEEEQVEEAVTSACPVPGLTGVLSANPLMRNLTDFLIDETSSEEEAILSKCSNYQSLCFPNSP